MPVRVRPRAPNVMTKIDYKKEKISIIGLGYVGLPLAVEFAKKRKVIAFDINKDRVKQLIQGVDSTSEVDQKLLASPNLKFTSNKVDLSQCKIYIVTVPTPVDSRNNP